jgi:hypothetical protein
MAKRKEGGLVTSMPQKARAEMENLKCSNNSTLCILECLGEMNAWEYEEHYQKQPVRCVPETLPSISI